MREKVYDFNHEGIEKCFEHKNCIENIKETLIEYPELFPIVLLGVLGLSVLIINPMASAVAYKSMSDSSIIAFKYLEVF